jgi:citronellol/citronellal dehydrogenase
MMVSLENKTILITGATRGIGREIALRCAREKANIVIFAKTAEKHPKLPGTLQSVADEIIALGGKALPIRVDVREDEAIEMGVNKAVEHFGGIDILINNASAISLTPTLSTEMKRFDLMFDVNVRATFACSKACIPYLIKSSNPHILTMSPPLNMRAKWFKNHVAYTMSKYGMSMCTLGMSEEFKPQHISVNSLWPKTTIATAAIEVNFPQEMLTACRKPAIVADAAYYIITRDSKMTTGNFFIDEDVLQMHGVTDFSDYAHTPGATLYPDLFLD